MTMTQYNWTSVVTSFINIVKEAGFTLVGADNGEEQLKTDNSNKASSHVCECDEGRIVFKKDGWRFSAFIVLGNDPCETVADYSWKHETPQSIQNEFDAATTKFSDKWEDRKCPTQ